MISRLPAVAGREVYIADDQRTRDIIREVINAHDFFRADYRQIGDLFAGGSTRQIASRLFTFLRQNVKYRIEGEDLQTSRSPGVILAIGDGDCKHYAGFIGGVLDAIGGIDWVYRFASYDPLISEPAHVFVVARDGDREIWIDPVLGSLDQRTPGYFFKIDKRPSMALKRIYGIGSDLNRVGEVFPDVQYYPAGFFNPLMRAYNALIFGTQLPVQSWPIRYFVDGVLFSLPATPAYKIREQVAGYADAQKRFNDLVPPVPQGLTVEYPKVWQGKEVPANMLRPYIAPDGSMYIAQPDGTKYDFIAPRTTGAGLGQNNRTYTNEILLADGNRLLNLLIAATGAIQVAYQPYPDAENTQRFYDTMLRLRDHNFMVPREIKTVAGSIIRGIGDVVEAIGEGFVKFIGVPVRLAFLGMVKVNAFAFASNLAANIDRGNGDKIRKIWEGFGGEWSALKSTVDSGKGKSAILGNAIGEPVTLAAALAAATPIIALLATFLKGVGGPEVDKVVDNAMDWVRKIVGDSAADPVGVSEGMGGKPVIIKNGDGEITIPPTPGKSKGVVEWMEDNPVQAGLIGAGIVVIGGAAIAKR